MRLDQLVPEERALGPDEMLDLFLGWTAEQGLRLYPHQEEAMLELFAGRHVVLDAPTGSGKSLVATALHFKSFCELGRSWYTAPIKALVSEKFFALCKLFGAEHVGMMTGDGAVNRDAPIVCCTAEILANLALRQGAEAPVHSVVMDEFHYYADPDRGMAWQVPLLTLPRVQFLLMSATLGDTTAIREDLQKRSGREVAAVTGVHRPVPLEFGYSTRPVHEAIDELLRQDRAPVYVVHFTQAAATERAQALTSTDYCSKEEKKAIAEAIRGFRFHSPFGPTIRRYLGHGIGLHHAGLLPRYRLLVERLAQQGLLKVICGTDTLGVGINVPIRTVLLTQLCKFDGEKVNILTVREFRQIAGRAGRAGYDQKGYVVVQAPEHVIENARAEARATDPKKKKKLVKAQPPQRGYKHWDEVTFQQLLERPCEALTPRFSVDHGRVLMLMQHAQDQGLDARRGLEAMEDLVTVSHQPAGEKERLKARLGMVLDSLVHAGVVGEIDGRLRLDPDLPRDFSLHHSLSLFLLDALSTLDPASETHAYDLLSWAEAILENPRAILEKQADRARGRLIAELKAQGVPYEDRIAAVEDVSWPKPNAEAIYALFNEYARVHPWVEGEGVRPKGVVRELHETLSSFGDYVKDLQLMRSEGVLLRYLSDAYKLLWQNVPPEHKTEGVVELTAWLRTLLGMVDTSLLTEWERLLAGEDAVAEAPARVDISADKKLFYARLRAEAHALVRALARQDWEEAAASLRRGEEDPWGPAELEAAMAPILAEGGLGFDHRARLAANTHVKLLSGHHWELRQRLVPAAADEEDLAWELVATVDLREDANPDGPLLRLQSIG